MDQQKRGQKLSSPFFTHLDAWVYVAIKLDNSAAERNSDHSVSERGTGCSKTALTGREASAAAYSICKMAKAKNLNVYRYMEYIQTWLPGHIKKRRPLLVSALNVVILRIPKSI